MGRIGHGRNLINFKPLLQATECFQQKAPIASTKIYHLLSAAQGLTVPSEPTVRTQTDLSLLESSLATTHDVMSRLITKPIHLFFFK